MTQCNVYIPGTTMFAHSSCCLHILLAHTCLYYYLLSPQYTVLHILPLFFLFLFYSYLYLYIFSCVIVTPVSINLHLLLILTLGQ